MVQLLLSVVSKFLTEDIIQRAFELRTNSKETIKSIIITRAAPAGEGLISAVYRITVTSDHHKVSFIAKGLVNDLLLRRTLGCAIYFKREELFFTHILPKLVTLQKSLGARECLQNNIPICYSSHIDGENDYILLEDLAETECVPVTLLLTEKERDSILNSLAHLHAVSFALRMKTPNDFYAISDKLNEVYYNERNHHWYSTFLKTAIYIDRETLAEFEDPVSSVYFKRFVEITKNDVYKNIIDLVSSHVDHPVFCHGDAWIPNFLYSEKRSVAIDFQLFRCASVATDLSYFLILCCHLCRNKEDFFDAVKIYYDSLVYYLNDMKIDANTILSWDTLNEELRKYGKFGTSILAALTSIPLLVSEKCDVLDKFEEKYKGVDRIPLEDLWKLTPIKMYKDKLILVNAIRVAVDVGLI